VVAIAISSPVQSIESTGNWMTNYGAYMARIMCMQTADGSPDWPWIIAYIGFILAIITGYLKIYWVWVMSYFRVEKSDRDRKMFDLANLFFVCAASGYLFNIVMFFSPVYRLQVVFLAILACFSLGFARNLGDFKISLSAKKFKRQLEEAEHTRRKILESISQGICLFGTDYLIQPSYSSNLENILKTENLEGKNIIDLLSKNSNFYPENRTELEASMHTVIGDSTFNFELNRSKFPSEIQITLDGELNYWECVWTPITDINDVVEKMMLCINDVTEIRKSREQNSQQQLELKLVGEMMKVDPSHLKLFFSNSKKELKLCIDIISSPSMAVNQRIEDVFFHLHTLKGNARTYGLGGISYVVHEVENYYDDLRKDLPESWNVTDRLNELEMIDKEIHVYKNTAEDILKMDSNIDEEEKTKGVEEALNIFKKLKATKLVGTENDYYRALSLLENSISSEFQALLRPIEKSLPEISKSCNKPLPVMMLHGIPAKLSKQYAHLMESVMTHLVRNSVDHGFSATESGEININIEFEEERAFITYTDNGDGLNLNKIRERGEAAHLIDEHASNTDIAELIFKSGMSSREEVSELSGRGVGMDAVKRILRKMGGDVRIDLDKKSNLKGFFNFRLFLQLPTSILSPALPQ